MTSGRKPIGDKAMTAAERMRRQRAKAREEGRPHRDQVIAALGRAAIELAPEIGSTATYGAILKLASDHLTSLGYKSRQIQQIFTGMKEGHGAR